ncbi:MAG: hypothetical protein AAF564_23865 [Bacteroidota bacterium]
MCRYLIYPFLLLLASPAVAQSDPIQIPMHADHWDAPAGSVSFLNHEGVPSMKINGGQTRATARDVVFENGTIEFDVFMVDSGFTIYFRQESTEESEIVYFRGFMLGNPDQPDVVQYSAVLNGILLWNVHGHYQGPAKHLVNDWTHVKLVVSGRRMLLYVHDMEQPALDIPHLEGTPSAGSIALEGTSAFANMVITPDKTEGLSPAALPDITDHDPRYLRNWEVSESFLLPFGHEMVSANRNFISSPYLPDSTTQWQPVNAERLGLVNLSRLFGESTERRGAWLRLRLQSEIQQIRRVDLGFLDEVWVLVNGQFAYVDKNTYSNPIMKDPAGRISIENTSFPLPLREGENEILIGLANNFWSWALIARLDRIRGISQNTP